MTLDDLRTYIPRATLGDQQPLREAARLIEDRNMAPEAFAALDQAEIEDLIREFVSELPPEIKQPALMASPKKLARAIRFSMARLHATFTEFPFVPMPTTSWVRPLPAEARPASLSAAVDGWTPSIVGQTSRSGNGKPLEESTVPSYRNKFWQYGALCVEVGAVLPEGITLAAITSKPMLELVMPKMGSYFGTRTKAPFLTAIKRIAADTLGANHPNVAAIAAAISASPSPQALPAKTIEGLRDLTGLEAVEEGRLTVWEISGAIRQRARAPGLRPIDVDRRLACAVAVAVCLLLVFADAEFLGRLNLDEAIRGDGDVLRIHWRDEKGVDHSVDLDEACRESVTELEEFRRQNKRRSQWLFPDRSGLQPRLPSASMQYLATNIEAVVGRRFTFVDLQDATVVNAIDAGESDINHLSDSRKARFVKSTRARFRVALNTPLKGRKGAQE